MKKSENPVSDLIKEAEINLYDVTVKSEAAYIDQDCSGSVKEYCSKFISKRTSKEKSYSNHYKQAPAERLVVKWRGKTQIVEVKYEKVN